jgi:hypothetical protein
VSNPPDADGNESRLLVRRRISVATDIAREILWSQRFGLQLLEPQQAKLFAEAVGALERLRDHLDHGFFDPAYPERACDRCGRSYRGPATYCSLECAMADA